ncbi:transposase [Streptomyces canus]|uniref:transposase n=1 Tax=Streptomyces canus TaxID=58343 RepID=UPI0033A35FF2
MGTYRYPAEFRADAVGLVRSSDRPVSRIAAELGVNGDTLRQWVKRLTSRRLLAWRPGRRRRFGPLRRWNRRRTRDQPGRRQVRELEMERDMLRRAAKYFAKETNGQVASSSSRTTAARPASVRSARSPTSKDPIRCAR